MKQVELKKENTVLLPVCWIADGFVSRLVGLMGRAGLSSEQGMCFPNCTSIHTCFMRFAIDVLFVSKDGTVVKISENLAPWRWVAPVREAKHVVELRGGRARELGIVPGCQLSCEGVWS